MSRLHKLCPCIDLSFLSISLFLFLFIILDLSLTTGLFIAHYIREVALYHVSLFESYSIGSSCIDVWITSLLKIGIFSAILFSFCVRKDVAFQRVNNIKAFIYCFVLLLDLWIFGKLLASFEFYSDGSVISNRTAVNSTDNNVNKSTLHPLLWSLLSWNVVTDIVYFRVLYQLVHLKQSQIGLRSRTRLNRLVNINEESMGEGAPLLREEPIGEGAPLLREEPIGKGPPLLREEPIGKGPPLLREEPIGEEQGTKNEKGKGDENLTGKLKGTLLLLSFCKPDLHYLLLAFVFLFIGALSNIFSPFYLGQVINHIVVTADLTSFYYSLIILVIVQAVSSIATGLRGLTFGYALARLNIRIRSRLFESIVGQEIGYFDETLTGDITSRLTSDTQQMSDQVTMNINVFLRNIIQIFGSIVFMFILSWKLTVAAVVAIPFTVYVYEYFGDLFKTVAKQIQDSLALANNVAEEVITSMRTVRSFANESSESRHYNTKLKSVFKYQVQEAIIYGVFSIIINCINNFFVIITLLYGGILVINKELTPGNLISYMFYWIALGECLSAVGDVYTGMMQAVGAAEKVFRIIQRKPKIDYFSGQYSAGKVAGLVEFRNVTFSYPTRQDVNALDNLSFTIQPGSTVALVGPSGGGKSTCINLLERFYEPQKGEILLDGIPISEYSHDNLHRQLSLVSQEPVLYARSISDNISYGVSGEVRSEDIKRVSQWANAHEFVVKLPKQYSTETGEKGTQLSGGQKQRVAIARAILRDPSVLLLDEATSALDAESESLVQEALNRQMRDRSVLIIAHRLSTVEKADRIIVIDEGRVVEEGAHQDLMQQAGLYSKLVYKQLLVGEEKRNENKKKEIIRNREGKNSGGDEISNRKM